MDVTNLIDQFKRSFIAGLESISVLLNNLKRAGFEFSIAFVGNSEKLTDHIVRIVLVERILFRITVDLLCFAPR